MRDREDRGALALVLVLAGLSLPAACLPKSAAEVAAENARYALELERCELSASTCVGYVACRRRVAESFGRTYSGRCAQ
jgi:hypothetical protein